MWFQRHLPILIALSGSLALHYVSFRGAQHYQVTLRPLNAPTTQVETAVQLSLLDPPLPDDPEKPAKRETPKKPDEKQHPDKPKPPDKPRPPKPQIKFPDEMGERTGKGIGSNQSEGIEPLKALEADEDQAFLSRNPGAAGRAANRPSNWLMSPGENGKGGHPGQAAPVGQSRSASDDVPLPADPLATQAPRPRESDAAADATPAAPPDLPVPSAQPEKPADRAAEPAEASPPQEAVAMATPPPAAAPAPPSAIPPKSSDQLQLSPVSMGPKISLTPPRPGDEGTKGSGEAGIEGDSLPNAQLDDKSSGLHRTTMQPSRQAGRQDGAPVALQLPVPFIAPTRAPDPKEIPPQPVKPAYALLVAPPAMPTPEPTQPTIRQQKPPQPADGSRDVAKPNVAQHAPPAPATPSLPSPAAGASASARATGDGRQPGSERPGGDPGQMSDSESDPFSKIGSAEVLRDGKLDVRFGRKIKTVRPHIPVVGQVDSFALLNPSVTLKVSIDATGKVTEVAVHKSSGSNEIDQPTLIAMYDWWFEPLHDAKGNAVPDCVLFTINFR